MRSRHLGGALWLVLLTGTGAAAQPGPALAPLRLRLRPEPLPAGAVEMLAGYGLWPPQTDQAIAAQVTAARRAGVGRMIVDTGLTELRRAYRDPQPYYDLVSRISAEARRQGVATAFYLPSFEIRKEREDASPERLQTCCREWAQVTLQGKPYIKSSFAKDEFWNRSGDEALWACPLSPWRPLFMKRIAEAVRRGAELLFLDVAYFQGGERATCRCRHCQARFRKDTGLSIPGRPDSSSRAYQRWLSWRGEVLAGFFREVRATARRVNPRARLAVEEYPSALPDSTGETGLDPGRHGTEVDLFVHEHSAKQFDKKPYSARQRLELAVALALYRGLDGERPSWVLSYAHDRQSSRSSAALHLAFDVSFWETRGPEMNNTTVDAAWRQRLFSWFAANRGAFGESRSLASVAVLYSAAAREVSSDHFPELLGVLRRLIQGGVPVRLLSTRDLAELSHYPVVILPSLTALSAAEAKTLRQSRSRLLVVGQPPALDPLGLEPRDHGLRFKTVAPARLLGSLGAPLLKLAGAGLAAVLLQRRGEVQVRLANLTSQPVRATLQLRLPGVASASSLSLLGKEQPLPLKWQGDQLQATLSVVDLQVIRLRLP